ncbi:hypothetical protein ACW9HJ_22875 [Nocardia gipuzkoensis]
MQDGVAVAFEQFVGEAAVVFSDVGAAAGDRFAVELRAGCENGFGDAPLHGVVDAGDFMT